MTSQRALVVNADDFGLTPGVNAGILDAHARGILTSASLFASAEATDEAVRIARRTPTLAIGCHLALVDGMPTLPPARVPTLAPGGRFRPTWGAFLRDAMAGRIASNEIEREVAAQIDRLRSHGLVLTHVDGHKHVHAYPPVFAIVARVARGFGIEAVRVPYETPALRLVARHAIEPGASRQAIENWALGFWARQDRAILRRARMPAPPRFLGRIRTGLWSRATFIRMLESVPPGISELMMHPGYPDTALDRVPTRLRGERATEVSLLTDPAALEVVSRRAIVLVTHLRQERRSHVA